MAMHSYRIAALALLLALAPQAAWSQGAGERLLKGLADAWKTSRQEDAGHGTDDRQLEPAEAARVAEQIVTYGPASNRRQVSRNAKIEATPLAKIFATVPFDPDRRSEDQYPRVALSVLGSPNWHSDAKFDGGARSDGCWVLEATLWRTAQSSEPVAPFVLCAPEDFRGVTAINRAVDWWNDMTFANYIRENGQLVRSEDIPTTGNRRTAGPLAPSRRVPVDPVHLAYYSSPVGSAEVIAPARHRGRPDRIQVAVDARQQTYTRQLSGHSGNVALPAHTMDAAMLTLVLWKMRFDYTVDDDTRVWLIGFSDAALID